ncbi:MAG: Na/Pi cotransporter family protein [Lachnospiraceae bacterium]|jgi:phosphate:Na+ symporter|nr:Na/Pi cotransporter family protein [Lachnospiraceae bacterium]MEE3460490.1 Na/Pi cotransporter family protein [Lachnospiraceae bacterium]
MSVFSFFTLFGGLAFFLFGMNLLSSSLEKMAGGKLEKLLRRMTDNPLKGFIAGALITIAIQSSSATTVMLVGFVNSGIMDLAQTVSVIFGADVGTTLTAWILSLTGIQGDGSIVLGLLKPENFSMVFALAGIIMLMAGKRQKTRDIGTMGLGFAVLMTGMTMMSGSMAPLADMPQFAEAMTVFNNPLFGVLIGTLITGIIQGSAATIGILQGLSMTGQITLGMAIPIVMGANIGTCMTAILSVIGVNRKAKRVAAVHVSIKIIGTILWLVVFYGLDMFFHFAFLEKGATTFNIAIFHTIFNVVNTAVLFWFQKFFVRLAYRIFPDTEDEQELFLDERLMVTPGIALAEVQNSMDKMIIKAHDNLDDATSLLTEPFDQELFDHIQKNESLIDGYEDHIGAYLMKLTTTQHLSEEDKRHATRMLQGIGEFERLADHASYISRSCLEMEEKEIVFSDDAKREIESLVEAAREIYRTTIHVYESGDLLEARNIEPLQDVIRTMCSTYKETHVRRLAEGTCSAVQGFVFNDLLYSFERIADHSMNLAAIVIRVANVHASSAQYMHDIKVRRSDPENERMYENYFRKYMRR